MTIIELPQELVLKIAAGEVIERPASMAKELVENSLDAGARRIEVEMRGGGIPFLRVTDSGHGIAPEEVELAFRRHATSKLSPEDDLSCIASLGFRGEALPSIATVAEVSMLTRSWDQPLGVLVRLKDGQVVEQGSRGCPPGTTITVRNLFSGLPARRKFLRPPASEGRRITEVVARYCLAYPEVQFLLYSDGRLTLQSPGDGQLSSAVAALYGPAAARSMVPLDARDATMAIQGLVSAPSETRGSRQYLNFFVNRRWVQNAFLLRAVEQAYHDLLPDGRYPLAVLNIYLPPDEVDVNIHPAKREVRFYREGELFSFVHRAVREAIAQFAPTRTAIASPLAVGEEAPNRPLQTPPGGFMRAPEGVAGSGVAAPAASPGIPLETPEASPLQSQLPILRVVGQMGDTYIIAEGPDGMYLVDQHTAHERVLYEKIKGGSSNGDRQGLLDPLVIELSPSQIALLPTAGEELARWGFEVEPLDQNACLVRAVPALLRHARVKEAFHEIMGILEETGGGPAWEDRLYQSMACHGAVRAGQTLSFQEMRELLFSLEATELPYTCPHGRPTMVYLSSSRLAREFGRG